MCEVSFDDGDAFSVWSETEIKCSRKAHRCATCRATIDKGSAYSRHFSVTGGSPSSEAQCLPCHKIAREFGDAHQINTSPSYLPTLMSNCVADDEPGAERWAKMLAEIESRG